MTVDSGKNLAAVLAMIDRGWHILPCHSIRDGACTCGKDCDSPGKHPMTRNGLKDARCDPEWARAVWEDTPWANIAVRTGPESKVWVLDVDGEAGIKDLERLEAEHGPLPRTPTVRTGSGGRHCYFAWPAG